MSLLKLNSWILFSLWRAVKSQCPHVY